MTEAPTTRDDSIAGAPLLVQAGSGLALTSLAWDPLLLVGIGALVVLGIGLARLDRTGAGGRSLAQLGLIVAGAVTVLDAWAWIGAR